MAFSGSQALEIAKRALKEEGERLKNVKITQDDFDKTLEIYKNWYREEGRNKGKIIEILSEKSLTSSELSESLDIRKEEIVHYLNDLTKDSLVTSNWVELEDGKGKVYSLNIKRIEHITRKRMLDIYDFFGLIES